MVTLLIASALGVVAILVVCVPIGFAIGWYIDRRYDR